MTTPSYDRQPADGDGRQCGCGVPRSCGASLGTFPLHSVSWASSEFQLASSRSRSISSRFSGVLRPSASMTLAGRSGRRRRGAAFAEWSERNGRRSNVFAHILLTTYKPYFDGVGVPFLLDLIQISSNGADGLASSIPINFPRLARASLPARVRRSFCLLCSGGAIWVMF